MQKIDDDIEIPSSFTELLMNKYGGRGNPNSAIIGHGWGMSHRWTEPDHLQFWFPVPEGPYPNNQLRWMRNIGGPTVYVCSLCGIKFSHYYHDIPDIFDAMKEAGIPDGCVPSKESSQHA